MFKEGAMKLPKSSGIVNRSVIGRRIVAFIIDVAIAGLITGILDVIPAALNANYLSLFVFLFGVLLVFCRDALGRSPGKALMRLRVIDIHTKRTASLYKRIVRNVTSPISFLEILFFRKNTGSRLSDLWLGVKVVSDTETLL